MTYILSKKKIKQNINKIIINPFFVISIIIFFIDIFFKYQTFFNLNKIHNLGTMYGLFQKVSNINIFFLTFNSIILILVVFLFIFTNNFDNKITLKKKQISQKSILCFLFFGAIGNLIDRIIVGAVIDYITIPYLRIFGIFNLSDCMILLFIFLMVLYEFFS